MIRAIGPSLGARRRPESRWRIRSSSYTIKRERSIATNDDWATNPNQQEIIDTGIAPTSPKESVILTRLPSDDNGVAYTVILRGAGDTTGVGLLEVYDLDPGWGRRR